MPDPWNILYSLVIVLFFTTCIPTRIGGLFIFGAWVSFVASVHRAALGILSASPNVC